MAADGSIIINTKLDTSGVNKGKMSKAVQAATASEIKKLNADIKEQEKTVASLTTELERLTAQYREFQSLGISGYNTDALDAFKVEKIAPAAAALEDAKAGLEGMRQKTAELTAENAKLIASKKRVEKQMKKTSEVFERSGKRIAMLARRVFLYSIVLKGLHGVLNYIKKASSTSTELTNALARMRGALATAFQPLWETILPHLITFVNILTKAVLAVAAFFSWLTGKSLAQSAKNAEGLNKQADAISKTGKAADKAKKSLAAFDEINNISSSDAESAGGGGSGASAPKFDFDNAELQKMADLMKLIGDYIVAIGLGLAAMGLARAFGAAWPLALGLALAVAGLYLIVKSFIDMWNNGVDWQGLIKMLAGITLLVGGLGLAFGAVGAAIGMLAGGVALLIVGFKDWIENGYLTTEAMTAIMAGILLVGGAIALLTGGWIPLLVAAVVALALFFVTKFDEIQKAINGFWDWLDKATKGKFTGIINWLRNGLNNTLTIVKDFLSKLFDSIKQIFDGIIKFFTGVFTGNWKMAWEGLKEIVKGVMNGIITVVEGAINWLLGGINSLIAGFNAVLSLGDGVAEKIFGGKVVRVPSIPRISIPRLAEGAVVPRNREFAAILGDNKTETEIVSPLSTMKQALLEALMESGGGDINLTVVLDGDVVHKSVVKRNNQATRRTGRNPLLGV